MVPPQPGQPSRPGTEYAEFRRLKGPEHGYVLAVPPSVLPTPAGLRPTVMVEPDKGLLILAGSPASARRARSALVLDGPAAGSPSGAPMRSSPLNQTHAARCRSCSRACHLWSSSSASRPPSNPVPW